MLSSINTASNICPCFTSIDTNSYEYCKYSNSMNHYGIRINKDSKEYYYPPLNRKYDFSETTVYEYNGGSIPKCTYINGPDRCITDGEQDCDYWVDTSTHLLNNDQSQACYDIITKSYDAATEKCYHNGNVFNIVLDDLKETYFGLAEYTEISIFVAVCIIVVGFIIGIIYCCCFKKTKRGQYKSIKSTKIDMNMDDI